MNRGHCLSCNQSGNSLSNVFTVVIPRGVLVGLQCTWSVMGCIMYSTVKGCQMLIVSYLHMTHMLSFTLSVRLHPLVQACRLQSNREFEFGGVYPTIDYWRHVRKTILHEFAEGRFKAVEVHKLRDTFRYNSIVLEREKVQNYAVDGKLCDIVQSMPSTAPILSPVQECQSTGVL